MTGGKMIIVDFTPFSASVLAGRTTIICGFQTNFRTLFKAGRRVIISPLAPFEFS
jgi:hypothetical protein